LPKFDLYVIKTEDGDVLVGDEDFLAAWNVSKESVLKPESGVTKYEIVLKSNLTHRMQMAVNAAAQADPTTRDGAMAEQYIKSWGDLANGEEPSASAFNNLHPNIAGAISVKLVQKIFSNLAASPDFMRQLGGKP
jgi:hypothetical protein